MHVLQFTNKYGERYYFVATGATHFSAKLGTTIHLIEPTTTDIAKARRFETEADARLILARTGNSSTPIDSDNPDVGWKILKVEE